MTRAELSDPAASVQPWLWPPKFEQLTDAQVRELYDNLSEGTVVGLSFYLDELRRRDYERTMKATNDLARRTFWLGAVSGVFSLVAVVAAIIALFP